jgi:hypothetical protein
MGEGLPPAQVFYIELGESLVRSIDFHGRDQSTAGMTSFCVGCARTL